MNLGKKISCPYCRTKLFTLNRKELNCPQCHKFIKVNINTDNNENNDEDEDLDNLTDEELLNKVIPINYYEVSELLNNLDKGEDKNLTDDIIDDDDL